jgi:NADH dehydrogenase FAD-containing subunit
LIKNKITPIVVVCGGGAAGVELAFSLKTRWSKLFNKDINVTIITNKKSVLDSYNDKTS